MKIYQAVQNFLVGDRQTDSHFGMIEVTFSVIICIQNFNQIHQSFQKLSGSRDNIQCHHPHTKLYPNPPNGSKVIKVFLYTHLRSLNARHFGMSEGTRLKM
jgi:hypothetical protein